MVLESINLKRYKKSHGRENQFFITSYIGISKIQSVDDKPDDLRTSWKPQNIQSAKEEAKLFVQRSSLVYSVSAFEAYLSDFIVSQIIPLNVIKTEELANVFLGKSISKKIEVLTTEAPELKNIKEYYLTITSIYWLNKLIHLVVRKLSGDIKGNLKSHREGFEEDYCKLNIEELIEHYDIDKVPTYKETLSMMSSLRNFAHKIDGYFMSRYHVEYIVHNIKRLIKEGKIKRIDFSQNENKRIIFWTNVFQVHLRMNVNDELRSLDIWNSLVSAKSRQELDKILSII